MTIFIAITQIGIFFLGIGTFIHALVHKKIPLVLFLLSDAFFFEYLIGKLYGAVQYNRNFILLADIPLIVVIGWASLLYVYIVSLNRTNSFHAAIYTALSMTIIDLCMEIPVVKTALWQWVEPSGYFGIPYNNFFAWFLYGLLITYFVSRQHTFRSFTWPIIAIVQITSWGLLIGFVWSLFPRVMQQGLFWIIMVSALLIVQKNKDSIFFDGKNIYLLILPLTFFVYSFTITLFIIKDIPQQVILFSAGFFIVWVLLHIRILRNTIYESDTHKQQHSSRSFLFE